MKASFIRSSYLVSLQSGDSSSDGKVQSGAGLVFASIWRIDGLPWFHLRGNAMEKALQTKCERAVRRTSVALRFTTQPLRRSWAKWMLREWPG